MRARLIYLQVEESRLHKVEGGPMWLLKNSSNRYNYQTNNASVLTQPIKPVLVGDGEFRIGDKFYDAYQNKLSDILDARGVDIVNGANLPKVISQDTESLYPQIASGELVEDVWYEFEEKGLLKGCNKESCWLTDECIGDCINKLSTPIKVVGEVEQNEPSDTSSEIPNN